MESATLAKIIIYWVIAYQGVVIAVIVVIAANIRERGRVMSKIKQHLEERIVISGSRQDNTGWKRYICFNYQGNEYELTLFWEEFNGYDTYWRSPDKAPAWVVEWDSEAHEGMSFEHYLDELTWEREKV